MKTGVFVYRNLHYRDSVTYSVRSNKTGRVVGHAPYVVIKDAKLKVSEAGRQRVLREGRKNVHAGVVGTWVRDTNKQMRADTRSWISGPQKGWVKLRYNPRELKTFVNTLTGLPVTRAAFVVIDMTGVWAYQPK